MCSITPNPRDFLTLVAAKNNLQLISVVGVFPKRRFNTSFFYQGCHGISFFQGGPVYNLFPQGDEVSPLFPKEV